MSELRDIYDKNRIKTGRIKERGDKLLEGATIDVVIENKSGNLDILVSGTNEEKIYKVDKATTGKFSLIIPKTDIYKFSVTGSNASGSVSFKSSD